MSEEEFKADAPSTATPKKPRARKAASANASAAGTADASASPQRKTPAKAPAEVAAATPPVSSPGTALAVQPGSSAQSHATDTPSTDTGAFSAAAAKVSAMIPENMTVKAREVAVDVKDKASDAVQGLARIISDSAGAIDDNVGPKYGDYARTAAQSVNDAADRLRAKPVDEIAADTREFVRAKPGTALGIAAIASLVLAKIFGSVFGKKR